MAAARTVSIALRHVTLSESTQMHELDDGVFVELDSPPPVRSLVVASAEEGKERTGIEITRVVEVADSDERGVLGFYGKIVDDDRLAELDRVGTEHLEGGEGATKLAEEVAPGEPANDTATTAMGEPAPVVDPDDSTPISMAEKARLEADAMMSSEAESEMGSEAESEMGSEAESESETSESEAESSEGTSKRRRRKGRKKR